MVCFRYIIAKTLQKVITRLIIIIIIIIILKQPGKPEEIVRPEQAIILTG